MAATLALALTLSLSSTLAGPLADHGYEMIAVQPGEFVMGTDKVGYEVSAAHPVRLTRSYELGRTEVTRALWDAVMADRGRSAPKSGCMESDCPVQGVTWYDAVAFCNALSEAEGLTPAYDVVETGGDPQVRWNRQADGYRLPTEAEYEQAARAGTPGDYAGSEDFFEVAPPDNKTAPVGRYAANEWGFHDLSGNLWEWSWDWFGPPARGPQTDPLGPPDARPWPELTAGLTMPTKSVRGGSMYLIPMPKGVRARTSTVWRRRYEIPSCKHSAKVGVRVARTVVQSSP